MREVLDAASERIVGRFADAPLIEASVRLTLGRTYSKLALYDEAATHLDRAVALLREGNPDDAMLHNALTTPRELKYRIGDYEFADTLLTEALQISQRAWGELDFRTASSMNSAALLRLQQGRIDEAEPMMVQSIEIGRALHTDTLGKDHLETIYCLHDLVRLYMVQENYAAAEPVIREIIERRLRSMPSPDTVLARVYDMHGMCLMQLDRFDAAEHSLLKAEALLEALAGLHAPQTQATIMRLVNLPRDTHINFAYKLVIAIAVYISTP
jgi:eukaryotic-like serine/threonine-protein kinase